jgi:hypothetical protein
MMKRIGLCFFVLALSCAGSAYAQCVVDTSTPTYANGAFLRYTPCDANGKIKTTGSGGGGGGDASEAEQQTQTGILTTIDADTGTIAGAVKAEDAAHSSGHTGIPFWGVRNDSAATSLTDTNGDYTPIATDSNGRLFINAISSIFSVTPGTTATALGKSEDAAHASGDTGVMSLCVRQDTEAALATTNGDYIPCTTDSTGAVRTTNTGVQITRPHALLADRVSGVAGITDGSSTSVVAAQGASTRFCATTIVVSNSSATNVTVDIRDGTAGSVLMTIPAAANMGGGVIPLAVPLCTSANTIFAADPSAAASTVTITAVGFKTTL